MGDGKEEPLLEHLFPDAEAAPLLSDAPFLVLEGEEDPALRPSNSFAQETPR
jgi:hypothetical protein